MFAVVATATGCLYFFGESRVASKAGLEAVAVLLMLINVACVLLMANFIVKAGLPGAKQFAASSFGKAKSLLSRRTKQDHPNY